MILYDLGLRPCWPKVSAKIGKLGPDPFEGDKEVDNPPLDLVKIRDTLGAGFRIMGGEEGEIIIKYDLGMGWHLNVFPVGDKILVHVGREGHHVYGKIIEQRFFQTEIKWLLKEYSHRKIRRRHREEESSFLL